jgi:hypothetical protein
LVFRTFFSYPLDKLTDAQGLDEAEAEVMGRFADLVEGKWFDIARPKL